MYRKTLGVILTAACLTMSELAAQSGRLAFDFLPGTWTTVKDGLSLTVTVAPALGGTALRETVMLDDNNRVIGTAYLMFREDVAAWTRTWFDADGNRSTFVGGPGPDGIALSQVSYRGRPFEQPQSRLVYRPRGHDRFTLDWQSSSDGGDSWRPRREPFEYRRVDRPEPPQGPGRIAFISNREGNWEIYTMLPDGSDVVNVSRNEAGDHYPNWIAGGSRLAFRSQRARDDGGWDRWEIDIDGTDPNPADLPARLPNSDFGTFPEVHPTGSWVAYAAERDGEQDIYVARFDGGGERVVAPAPGLDYRPRWSPDGSKLLFVSERDGNAELYLVEFDGSGLTRLTDNPGNDRYGHWSPDGRRIAFASARGGAEELDLFVMAADGSDVRRLTDTPGEEGEVSWSPDGRMLAFRTDMFGNSEVATIDLVTGQIANVSRNDAYDAEPVWSP